MKRQALVIVGSRNEERDLALISGSRVADALRRRSWSVEEIDGGRPREVISKIMSLPPSTIVVPIAFGAGGGEDGKFHTVATLAGVPCTGPTATAGEISINKKLFETFVEGVFKDDPEVKTPKGCLISHEMSSRQVRNAIVKTTTPLVIKPNFGGSSIGLSVALSHDEAVERVLALLPSANAVLCQELVSPAQELSLTILDREGGPVAFPIVGIKSAGESAVFDYQQKFGASANDHHLIPAPIDSERAERIRQVCLRIHTAIGAVGLFRYDVLLTPTTIVMLEVNATPGLLPTSIASDAAKAAGVPFEELVEAFALSALLPRVQASLISTDSISN